MRCGCSNTTYQKVNFGGIESAIQNSNFRLTPAVSPAHLPNTPNLSSFGFAGHGYYLPNRNSNPPKKKHSNTTAMFCVTQRLCGHLARGAVQRSMRWRHTTARPPPHSPAASKAWGSFRVDWVDKLALGGFVASPVCFCMYLYTCEDDVECGNDAS